MLSYVFKGKRKIFKKQRNMPYAHSDYSNLSINSIKNFYLNYSSTNYEFDRKEGSEESNSKLNAKLNSKLNSNILKRKTEQNYDYKPLSKLNQHRTKNRQKRSDLNGNEVSNRINNKFNYKNKRNRFKENEQPNDSKYLHSKFVQDSQVNSKPLLDIKLNNYEKYLKKSNYLHHQSSTVSSASDSVPKSSSLNDDDVDRRAAIVESKKTKQTRKRNQSTLTNLFYQYTALMQSQLIPALFMSNNSTKLLPNLSSNFTDNVTTEISNSLSNSSFDSFFHSSESITNSSTNSSSTNNSNYFFRDFSFLKPQVSFLISSFNQNTYESSFKTTNTSDFDDQLNSLWINQDQTTSIYTLPSSFQELNLNLLLTILISVIMVVCILVTAIGNLFVIAAILSDRVLVSLFKS